MTSLITGMAGFVGQHLSALLRERGEEYAGFDHEKALCPDPACRKLNLLDAKALDSFVAELKPERIFHLAGQSRVARSWAHPEETFRINVVGTLNLLAAMEKYAPGARLLLVSTSEVYGRPRLDGRPLTEADAPEPQNPYALSKLAAELYAMLYHRLHNLEVIRVRPQGHTGPGQARGFVVPDFTSQIVAIENGRQAPVMKVGNLSARREFMDVRDVVRAYFLLTEKGKAGEVYNLASGRLHSVQEMLDLLLELSGLEVRVEVDAERFRPVDTAPLELDASRLVELTGWKPEYDLHRTLSELLECSRG
jgi:GDP-4-dehydro-6-deoxy-D-mannose reductase